MDKKLEEKLSEFEHIYNPRHFYCRLKELNIPKPEAKRMAEVYEIGIYKEVMDLVREYNTE